MHLELTVQSWFGMHHGLAAVLCLVVALIMVTRIDGRFRARRLQNDSALRRSVALTFGVLALLNALAIGRPEITSLIIFIDAATIVAPVVLVFVAMGRRRMSGNGVVARRSVLVIGAHPDDIELGCGGTVARMADRHHAVHALVMSRGQFGGDATERVEEAKRGAESLSATSIDVLDFPDTALSSQESAMVLAIEACINEHDPDVILTHSQHDQHQDHAAVHLATLRAARRRHSILCYESPSATRAFNPTVFVDIDGFVDMKIAAVRLHRDQAGKPYMSARRVRGVAAFRGQQARLVHAEAFEPVRLVHSAMGALD